MVKKICAIKKLLLTALVFGASASCSVKEPRCGGPCWIYVDSGDRYPVSVALWNGDEIAASGATGSHRVFEFTTDRDVLIMTGVSGDGSFIPEDGILRLTDGQEVDSVFACRSLLNCTGECVRDTVRCCKQFAAVRLVMDMPSTHQKYPDSIRVVSRWNGLDIREMNPVAGMYVCSFRCGEDVPPIRVMRQGDDSLYLEFFGGDGTLLDVVHLGLLLQKAGYDWSEENLKDAEVILSATGIELSFAVRDWETGESVNIEI